MGASCTAGIADRIVDSRAQAFGWHVVHVVRRSIRYCEETDGEDMVIKDHECYFSADHAAKDSGIALKLAEEQHLKLPLAKATFKQYEKMKELGLGELDKSGVAELTFKGRTLHS